MTNFLYTFKNAFVMTGNLQTIKYSTETRVIFNFLPKRWEKIQLSMKAARQTHRSEDSSDLLQDFLHIVHRTQDQCADNYVHRPVLYAPHVLPGDSQKLLIGQVLVGGHAHPQVPLEVRVGIGAGHRAAVGVKLQVRSASTADLQQPKSAVCVCKCRHVSKKLSLYIVHFVVVRKRAIVDEQGK